MTKRIRPLTMPMENVLVDMIEGFQLYSDSTVSGGFGYRSLNTMRHSRQPNTGTVFALMDRKLIDPGQRCFPTTDWHLTDRGRKVAEQIRSKRTIDAKGATG